MDTDPDVGSTMRLIIRRRVVLPQPLDPTKTVVVREGMTRWKSSTAVVPSGYVFRTDRNSIMVGALLFGGSPTPHDSTRGDRQRLRGDAPCRLMDSDARSVGARDDARVPVRSAGVGGRVGAAQASRRTASR
ncbi:hypothetical protein GCM10009769_12390 [Curtobacterium luteum]|uniref:Uncharacterized protein n=1 Tax=Curtobacterium luteum TaxID=33881 RepID=A0A8H9G7D8_9MICO|nr:hypothetical protein GCM10009769_12390 [Curtobacterium luteum]